MSGTDSGNPANPQQPPISPLIAQDEIDALLAQLKTRKPAQVPAAAQVSQAPVPAPPPFVPGQDLGLISQNEIDSLLSGAKPPVQQQAPARPPEATALPAVSVMDQKEIDKLLAAAAA